MPKTLQKDPGQVPKYRDPDQIGTGMTNIDNPLLAELNSFQQEAVKATEGPILILAGAGSGKTKALTHRVAYLIKEKHVAPENILVQTFTNKAANEMKKRIVKLLELDGQVASVQPTMGTFHSVCARILRKDGANVSLAPNFTIYDENDSIDAIKQAMSELDIPVQKTSPWGVKGVISSAKNEMIPAYEYPTYAKGFYQETVARIYLQYQKILETNRAVDFDDLLLLTVKLFQNHPQVLASYQMLWQYILIDEYQDTNLVQYLLSKMLAKRYRNICVVGDASQSIYKFRGADFRNIVNFKNDYPEAKVFNLEQNYRSTQNILDAAFSVISKNHSHPILKLWTENPSGDKIKITEVRNETEEAMLVVTTIKETALPLNNYAVLFRTNAQSRTLEEVFLKQKMPYILVGGIRFYERKEIKDMLAYLRLLVNPNDSVSKTRIEKIGKTRAANFFRMLQEILPNLQDYQTLELLDKTVAITNYLEYIDDGTDLGKSKVENVKELRSVAEETPDLVQFLENVALVESEYTTADRRSRNKEYQGVTLTTMHQAKGLEWPVVFIVGMEEGLFPHSRCLLNPEEMEEERRLCYVGITRAKDNLCLTYARQRLYFGSRTNNLVSRFITDIPQTLIDSIDPVYSDSSNFTEDVSSIKDDDDWLSS